MGSETEEESTIDGDDASSMHSELFAESKADAQARGLDMGTVATPSESEPDVQPEAAAQSETHRESKPEQAPPKKDGGEKPARSPFRWRLPGSPQRRASS